MRGYIVVRKLTKKPYYVSEIDWDNSFKDKGNPKGYFKMLIEPIENSDDKYEIRYMKADNGIKVSGEAYIFTGRSEKQIDNKIAKFVTVRKNYVQTEVNTEEELW
jgi:hypothetical protein